MPNHCEDSLLRRKQKLSGAYMSWIKYMSVFAQMMVSAVCVRWFGSRSVIWLLHVRPSQLGTQQQILCALRLQRSVNHGSHFEMSMHNFESVLQSVTWPRLNLQCCWPAMLRQNGACVANLLSLPTLFPAAAWIPHVLSLLHPIRCERC